MKKNQFNEWNEAFLLQFFFSFIFYMVSERGSDFFLRFPVYSSPKSLDLVDFVEFV